MGEHLNDDAMEAYAMGKVGPDTVQIKEHLASCADCTEHLRETQDFVDAMRSAAALHRALERGRALHA